MVTYGELKESIQKHKTFGWDLETTSLDVERAQITHIAIASPEVAECFRVSPESIEFLVSLLTNPEYAGLVHNAPYDYSVMHYSGALDINQFKCKLIDTMVLAWLADEEQPLGLKELTRKWCRIKVTEYSDVFKTSPQAIELSSIRSRIESYKKSLSIWEQGVKRPWPEYDGKPSSVNVISKSIKQANPDLSPKERKAKAEELLSEKHREEFRKYIELEENRVAPKIIKLEAELDVKMRKYATADAANLFKIYKKIVPVLKRENTTHAVKVEMAARLICIKMRIHGMPVNEKGLEEFGHSLDIVLADLKKILDDVAGIEVDPNSPKKLQHLIFEHLKVQPPIESRVTLNGRVFNIPKFTKGASKHIPEYILRTESTDLDKVALTDVSNYESYPPEVKKYLSTDTSVLLRLNHAVGQAICDYRTAEKLRGTYVVGGLEYLRSSRDGRLHGTFNSIGTVTGRTASLGPNLQQIPSRGKGISYAEPIRKLGPKLRRLFIAPPPNDEFPDGYVLLVADHSQVELRLAAHFTDDPHLKRAYQDSVSYDGMMFYTVDIHQQTAELTGSTRSVAKNTNFGLLYGMGPDKFARQNRLLIPGTNLYDVTLAKDLSIKFFKAYKQLQSTANKFKRVFDDEGVRCFTTISGRIRHFPEDARLTGGAIINSKIQGSGADILKYNIYIIDKYVCPAYPGVCIIGQIHDELVLVIPKKYEYEVGLLIKYVMEYPWYKTAVPILASAKTCSSWAAKDDDSIPEIGYYYAEIDGNPRLFDRTNWSEFLELDKQKRVTKACTVAQLSSEQKQFCRTIIPDDLPKVPVMSGPKVLTRAELLAKRNHGVNPTAEVSGN